MTTMEAYFRFCQCTLDAWTMYRAMCDVVMCNSAPHHTTQHSDGNRPQPLPFDVGGEQRPCCVGEREREGEREGGKKEGREEEARQGKSVREGVAERGRGNDKHAIAKRKK